MRALVLGATGHIGAHIVRRLLFEGHSVRAAFHTERYLSVIDKLPVERVKVDLNTGEGLASALNNCDWVFHAAAFYPRFAAKRGQAIVQAIESARRTLELFKQANPKRIVFTSSAATIARVQGRMANENDAETWPLKEEHPLYATVKIAIEHEMLSAAQSGLPVVAVNPTICLGEYDAHPFSGRLILAYAKHRLPFYLDKTFSFIYTGDVAVGHVRAAEQGRIGERYLLTHQTLPLETFARMVCRAAGRKAGLIGVPAWVASTASEISEVVAWISRTEPVLPRQAISNTRIGQNCDGSKANKAFNMPQTSLEEAVRRALAWFRENNYL